jgi:hypothetical protein
MMAGYPKIWSTKLMCDSWFVGLSGLERGVWLQLIILAKMCGDSGEFSFRSYRHLGESMGLNHVSLHKIVSKFTSHGKISVDQLPGGSIRINLLKYRYYQELKDEKEVMQYNNNTGK